MLTVKSKEQNGQEILINENNILYAIPSLDGGTVVYFSNDKFLVLLENFNSFKNILLSDKKVVVPESTPVFLTEELVYPNHLPKLANGNVDKRTIQYKEWQQSL